MLQPWASIYTYVLYSCVECETSASVFIFSGFHDSFEKRQFFLYIYHSQLSLLDASVSVRTAFIAFRISFIYRHTCMCGVPWPILYVSFSVYIRYVYPLIYFSLFYSLCIFSVFYSVCVYIFSLFYSLCILIFSVYIFFSVVFSVYIRYVSRGRSQMKKSPLIDIRARKCHEFNVFTRINFEMIKNLIYIFIHCRISNMESWPIISWIYS